MRLRARLDDGDGSHVVFTVVDLFRFESAGPGITSLDIVYDTHPVGAEHGDEYETLATDSGG